MLAPPSQKYLKTEYLYNIYIWGQKWVFDTRVTIYRVKPYPSVINFVEITSYFGVNVFLWLLCIIKRRNGPNWEVICMIPTFG